MRSIHPSETIKARHPALLSSLQTSGLKVANGAKPGADDLFVVAHGEYVPLAARTLVIGDQGRQVIPFRNGDPARVAHGPKDATVGNAFVRALLAGPETPVAEDAGTLALFALAGRVAAAGITVLVDGPTGSGKDVLARFIHDASPRKGKPFVALNCTALSETMLEALLFGHQRGAFTGASPGGEGFFRAADGGTLLLDGIAEMPLSLQAKLLRVLQEREVVPLGASTPQPVDVRVVACTGRDLPAEVAAGRFRADLYYRLSVVPLTAKPLAERRDDILGLAATMILRHAGTRTVIPWPTPEAVGLLVAYDWPGNVRELENVIQRSLLFADGGTIEAAHIVLDRPAAPPRPHINDEAAELATSAATLGKVVQMSEFAAIRETLRQCGGSRVETARRLGISERTLRYRLAKAREQGEAIDAPRSWAASA